MKKLFVFLIAVMMSVGLSSPASALDLRVGPFLDGVTDTTMRVTGFSRDSVSQIGTGLCYGTLFKITNGEKEFANLFSPCVLGAATYNGEAETDVLVGTNVFHIMIFDAGILYNTTRSEPRKKWYDNFVYGLGVTLTDFGNTVSETIRRKND